MKYTYERLLSFSDNEIKNIVLSGKDNGYELFKAYDYWQRYYLDESDKALTQRNQRLGEDLSAKSSALDSNKEKTMAYFEMAVKKGLW